MLLKSDLDDQQTHLWMSYVRMTTVSLLNFSDEYRSLNIVMFLAILMNVVAPEIVSELKMSLVNLTVSKYFKFLN